MNSKLILLSLLLSISFISAQSQVRVMPGGKVQVGPEEQAPREDDFTTNLEILGTSTTNNAGSRLTFGDVGRYENGGINVILGEYGTDDTDQLWLHGKLGYFLTSGGRFEKIVAYYDPANNSNFVFNTNLQVNGVNVTSDDRLKDNVQALKNPLSTLDQINGVSYTFSLAELQKNSQQDGSKFTNVQGNNNIEPRTDTGSATNAKDEKYKQIKNEIENREAAEASLKRIGFIAQDVQKVLPELVHTNEKGIMSVDYIGFIPILVESVKEMQGTINKQQEEINKLQKLLNDNQKQ